MQKCMYYFSVNCQLAFNWSKNAALYPSKNEKYILDRMAVRERTHRLQSAEHVWVDFM